MSVRTVNKLESAVVESCSRGRRESFSHVQIYSLWDVGAQFFESAPSLQGRVLRFDI